MAWWLTEGLVTVSQLRLMQSLGEARDSDGTLWPMALASALLWVPFTVLGLRLAERLPLGRERLGRAGGRAPGRAGAGGAGA
ncbi:hypothetical protein ACLESD_03000, partial [Pyxidicoccus sp. 3LFB2]